MVKEWGRPLPLYFPDFSLKFHSKNQVKNSQISRGRGEALLLDRELGDCRGRCGGQQRGQARGGRRGRGSALDAVLREAELRCAVSPEVEHRHLVAGTARY